MQWMGRASDEMPLLPSPPLLSSPLLSSLLFSYSPLLSYSPLHSSSPLPSSPLLLSLLFPPIFSPLLYSPPLPSTSSLFFSSPTRLNYPLFFPISGGMPQQRPVTCH